MQGEKRSLIADESTVAGWDHDSESPVSPKVHCSARDTTKASAAKRCV